MVSMLAYIEEQDVICRSIIQNKDTLLEEFRHCVKSHQTKKWIFLATGSSLNAVNSARMYIEHISGIEVEVRIPSEFYLYSQLWDKEAFLFGVSQSGRSASTINAIEKALTSHKAPVFGITANENSKLVNISPSWIKIDCGEEKIGFVTKGFSATVITLMLMGLEMAYLLKKISLSIYESEIDKLIEATYMMKEALDLSKEWYINNKDEIMAIGRIGIIAYGPTMGSAKEAETKLTETVRCPSTGFELEEFIHGPNYEVNENYNIFYIGVPNVLHDRLIQVKKVFEAYSKHSFYFGWDNTLKSGERNIVFSKDLDEYLSPLVAVVPFQYLAYQLPTDKGVDLTIKLQKELDEYLKRKI